MSQPLVSIVTPVYNGEAYLAECIESVLAQRYCNWEYLIVDNCSTDRTKEIASAYAERDARIQVHSYPEFVTIVQNFNRAVAIISSDSKYCKLLCADDWMFPHCVDRLVAHVEANPSVGIAGSYQLSGGNGSWCIKYDGIGLPSDKIAGFDICRWHLLGKGYVFGTPTTTIYRSDLVRTARPFFPGPPSSLHCDASACYEQMKTCDFGFVHEVLSFERVHPAAASAILRNFHSYTPGIFRDLLTYGPYYLTEREFDERRSEVLSEYYSVLARGVLRARNMDFWRYHSHFLKDLGYPILGRRLAAAVLSRLADKILNPKRLIESLLREFSQFRAARGELDGAQARSAPGPLGMEAPD